MLAYSIAQRRQELRIRLALGAERSDILRLVVGQGMALMSAGILVGLALAVVLSLALTRVVSQMLFK
jgi:putative ABC transport system permease protein